MTEAIGMALVHLVWQGALVAALLAAALHLTRRANLRYMLSCAALIVLLGLGVATAFVSYETPVQITPIVIDQALDATYSADLSSATITSDPWLDVTLFVRMHSQTLVVIWMAGVVILAARLGVSWRRAHRLAARLTTPAPPEWQQTVERLARSIGLRRAVRVLSSAAVEVPAVIGWLRPAILLPISTLGGLSPAQLEMILAHELAHIRRHDFFVNMLQSVVETLLFYHPAVWWMSRQVRIEREHCCDDMAVLICGNPVQYARALTVLEQLRDGVPAAAVAVTGGSLFQRVRRLVATNDRNTVMNGWTAAAAVITLAAVIALSSLPALADRAAEAKPAASEIDVEAPAPPPSPAAEPDPAPAPEPHLAEEPMEPEEAEDPEEPAELDDFEEFDELEELEPIVIDIDTDLIAETVDAAMLHVPAMLAPFPGAGNFDDDDREAPEAPRTDGRFTIDELITLKIHDLTPEYINQIQQAGLGKLSIKQILAMKIHNVTPKYIQDLRASGLVLTNHRDVVALKIHNVTPEFVRQLRAAGYEKLTARDVARLAASGVNADFIREMSKYRTNNK